MTKNILQQDSNKQKITTVLTHLICLGILFILPEVVMNISDIHHNSIPPGVYVKNIIFLFSFYINYYYIIDKCIGKNLAVWRLIGYNFILLIIAMIIIHTTWELTAEHKPIHAHPHEPAYMQDYIAKPNEHIHLARSISLMIRDLIILILTISLSVAVKLSSHFIKEKRMQQESLTIQREEELKSLKNQLNPHFLFNSLNCIYSLISIDQEKAQTATHKLSQLLRYVTYESSREVTLQQELDFINNYVELMSLRFGSKNSINFTHNIVTLKDTSIAPLLFVSIIENVFKYGNTGNPQHKINISLTEENGVITCSTFNHYIPQPHQKATNGIGISNLKQRLKLLYGDNACLAIDDNKDNRTFHVKLTIKITKIK